jgi:hypothetical protein
LDDDPPAGAKLGSPDFAGPKFDPSPLPNPDEPSPPNPPVAILVAKGEAPPKPEDEPNPLLGLAGPKDPSPEPEPGPPELRLPKGDFEEVAKAERPDDAKADEDVRGFSLASGSDACAELGDFGDTRAPNGDTADVLANPEDFSTCMKLA